MSDFDQTTESVGSGASPFSGLSDPINHYDVGGTEKSQGGWTPSYQSWESLGGFGAGNRKSDTPQVDPKKPGEPGVVKNATMGAPSVDQVDLSKLKVDNPGPTNGFYDETAVGTIPWTEKWGSGKLNKDGYSADIWSGSAVAGARRQAGIRGTAEASNEYGTAKAT